VASGDTILTSLTGPVAFCTSHSGDFLDEAQSQELIAWLVETADNFARVFPPYL
jgi:hypothetical protein